MADELGYVPNRLASALRGRRSQILGFVSDHIATTPFATRVLQRYFVRGLKAGSVNCGPVICGPVMCRPKA